MNLKIAVIDDHKLYLESLRSYLEMVDDISQVNTFLNLNEYTQNGSQYDVVLLDLNLDGKSGFDLFKLTPNQKVLMTTSHKEVHNVNLAYSLGAYGYIVKTSSTKEMLLAIRTIANGEKYFSKEVLFDNKMSKGLTLDSLSEKQIEILRLIVNGHTYKQIAKKLYISINTVKVHKYNIINKLNLRSEDDLKFIFREYFDSKTNNIDSKLLKNTLKP